MRPEEAFEIIQGESGEQFDPVVVEAFTRCFDEFTPVGEVLPWMQSSPHPSAVECNPFTELAQCST